jgi:valyl-tRNA synthetase
MIAAWPEAKADHQNPEIEQQFAQFQAVLAGLREIRSSQNIAPREVMEFAGKCPTEIADLLEPMEAYFQSMAGAKCLGWGPEVTPPATSANRNAGDVEIFVDMKDFIDLEAETTRNEKEREKILGWITGSEKKLGNESFVSRAKPDVVQRERDQLAQLRQDLAGIEAALEKLRLMA